jgi:hypothetical protein
MLFEETRKEMKMWKQLNSRKIPNFLSYWSQKNSTLQAQYFLLYFFIVMKRKFHFMYYEKYTLLLRDSHTLCFSLFALLKILFSFHFVELVHLKFSREHLKPLSKILKLQVLRERNVNVRRDFQTFKSHVDI